MPEGDTIWRTARTLDRALAGRRVTAFASPIAAVASAALRLEIVGLEVEGVEARGKHLLVRFTGGATLHTHMRMSGSWHLQRHGAATSRVSARARVFLETEGAVATCHRAPVVELLSASQAARHPALSRLGPDLLGEDFDPARARARLRATGTTEIGVALLDQAVLSGIGNVYKSEVLFACRVSPLLAVSDLEDVELDHLVATVREMMRRNLGPGARRTTSGLAPIALCVYGRAGRPCPRCGSPVRRVVQGEQRRSTYFCSRCQAAGPPGGDPRSSRPR